MANIRIKDLSTTAAVTASDDFIAVDGATNGTRKLNAYSPTFGGNLTVSGTGNNVFRGPIRWGNTSYPGYNGYITETNTDSQLIPAITRNLIGTTGNTQYTIANAELGAYAAFELGTNIRWFAGSGTFTTGQTITPTELMRLTQGGNLLLKSDGIDSGNGKLQLATHSNSAGGIGFGTDIALYRAGGNTLKLELGVSAGVLWFDNGGNGTGGARILGSSGALTVTSNGANSLYLQTGGTTALTLDSSQNATFAAKATVYGILTTSGGGSDGAYGVSQYYGSQGVIYPHIYRHKVETTHSAILSNNKWKLSLCDGTTTGFIDSVEFTPSGAVFAGNIKTAAPSGGTAATWRLGTVASVSPTSPNRTIEVEIGGTTYYIHAKTTNN